MKPKDYARKYVNSSFDVLFITEDLAEDYKGYLKLHEGIMTTIRFRNGAKEIFEKIKAIARRLELTDEQHSNLAKYFYARIIIPSYKIYWPCDDYQSCAQEEVDALKNKQFRKIRDANDETRNQGNKYRPNTKVTGSMFTNKFSINTFLHNDRASGYSKWWETSSFYTFLKEGLGVPFDIDQDLVISDITANEYRQRKRDESTRGAPSLVKAAADFLGLLDDFTTLTIEQVKSSYRALSKIHHPDLGGSVEQFIKLKQQVEILLKYC